MDRRLASETFIELCGETLYAVTTSLADAAPTPLTLASALYAAANAAEGALALVRAAAAVRQTCALVDACFD